MFRRPTPTQDLDTQAAAIIGASTAMQRIASQVDNVLRQELQLNKRVVDYAGRTNSQRAPAARIYPWSVQLQRPDITAIETPFGYRLPIARIAVDGKTMTHTQVQAAAAAITLRLGVPVSFEPTPGGGPLQIWVPKRDPAPTYWYNMLTSMDSGLPAMHTAVGLDRLAAPVVMDWANGPDKHVAVLGTTTSGKSRLADMMLLSLALHTPPSTVRYAIFDCKDRSHDTWQAMPHTMLYAGGGEHNKDEILHAIMRLHAVIADRHANGITEGAGRVGVDVPYIVALFDDAREPEGWDNNYHEIIGSLLRLGASAGLRVILTAHDMKEDYFGDASRTNLSTRIVAGADIYKSASAVGGARSGAHEVDRSQRQFVLRQNNQTSIIYAPHLCQQGRFLDVNRNNRDDVQEVIDELRRRHGNRLPFPWPENASEPYDPAAAGDSKIINISFSTSERQSGGVTLSQAVTQIKAALAGWPADREFKKADAAEAVWGRRTYSGNSAASFIADAYDAATTQAKVASS